MPIEFRRTGKNPETKQAQPSKGQPTPPWIRPATKPQVEEQLFHFLRSLLDGNPRASTPLLVEQPTLRELYTDPHPDLAEALRRCLERFLLELTPNPAQWGELELSPAVWGVALAAYHCLIPSPTREGDTPDPVADFTTALIATLPPARDPAHSLAYHAVLQNLSEIPPERLGLLQDLLKLSPLSAVYHLHLVTPPPLTPLAAELLSGWKERVADPVPWRDLDDWLDTLAPLLARPAVVRYLRQRWLDMPETRNACRNLGLLLEALRRRGSYRELILGFYEAYEYFNAEMIYDPWRGRKLPNWPVLDESERLLRAVEGSQAGAEAAIRLNRWGNEYFFKFRPLIQLIIAEGKPPADFFHLRSLPMVLRKGPYLGLITETAGQELDLGGVEYEEDG